MEDKRKQFEQTAMANMGFLERNKALADLSAEEGKCVLGKLVDLIADHFN